MDTTIRKTIDGNVYTVETVVLAKREQDAAPREMGVVWLSKDGEEPVRLTDFSGMHKQLAQDTPIRAIIDEKVVAGDNPEIHRNLVSFVAQPAG